MQIAEERRGGAVVHNFRLLLLEVEFDDVINALHHQSHDILAIGLAGCVILVEQRHAPHEPRAGRVGLHPSRNQLRLALHREPIDGLACIHLFCKAQLTHWMLWGQFLDAVRTVRAVALIALAA